CEQPCTLTCVRSQVIGRIDAADQVLVFFFFQAEDGIRDRNVTGVQTCALPIYSWRRYGIRSATPISRAWRLAEAARRRGDPETRSEERRVGKECRSGGGP